MLNAYYKWVFSMRGKKVERLEFFETKSRIFRRSLGTLVNAKALQDNKRGDVWRKIVKGFLVCGIISSSLLIIWMIWESRWIFEIY
jgi:hypothetical protein